MSQSYNILPGILTVDDVLTLPVEILRCLTNVTTSNIESFIDSFINYVSKTGGDDYKEAAKKLTSVYSDYKVTKRFVDSPEMNETIQMVINTNLIDISYNTDTNELIKLKSRMTNVLDGEEKLIKLDSDNFEATTQMMVQLAMESEDPNIIGTTNKVVSSMKKMKSLFINKNGSGVQSSRLNTALKFKEKINSLITAIDDVLDIKATNNGSNPREWRCL